MNATDIVAARTKRMQAALLREAAAKVKSTMRLDEACLHNTPLSVAYADLVEIAGHLEQEAAREESR